MKLREKLFGKTDKQKHVSGRRMSPLLEAMAREIPRWPPQHRGIMEKIVSEAAAAGVSSLEDFSAFLDSAPDLRAGYYTAMSSALGSEGKEMPSTMQRHEAEPLSRLTIPKLGIHNLDLSSPEEMGAFLAGNPEKSIDLNTHILETSRTSGDRLAEAVALGELGLAYARLNQLPKAIYYFEHHLEISRELGNWEWEMEDCRNLGRAYLELGENEKARSIYEEALQMARRQGDREWTINHSYSLASVYARMDNIERAAELTKQANALSNQAGR